MSHYPSSAELAAFRRYLAWGDRPIPDACFGWMGTTPASRWERSYGIPTVEAGQRDFAWDARAHSRARFRSSDMRRSLFARVFGNDVTWSEILTYAPLTHRCVNCRSVDCPEGECIAPGTCGHAVRNGIPCPIRGCDCGRTHADLIAGTPWR